MTYRNFTVTCRVHDGAWLAVVTWQGQRMYEGYASTRRRALAEARAHIRQVLACRWW